ncbi:MAG TPA: zinc ribbon domain-containing protein [Arachnia sp.]|nr:zinc ribbon domain-containing protein [Arachnia sp.]HMT87606.1 zinc ribbon domain-containing protein [Arachnia sp.]
MPTYQYRCTECGSDLEVVQKFTDATLTQCPECQGQLRKVFSAVGVVFKGSGFYATDSRSKKSASSAASASGDSSAKDSGSKKEASKNGAAPAAAASPSSTSTPAAAAS